MPVPPKFYGVIACSTALKLLLLPTYRSTDFEVHRNWLAITHSLPLKQWYYDSTSPWTLDYPPLFAWFQYILSFFAPYFDPDMLDVNQLNYASKNTVAFMRFSVIFSDLLLAYAIKECCVWFPPLTSVAKSLLTVWADDQFILSMLVLTNAGLFMVDHIHFQYNGFLFGVLLLSVARILQNRPLESAFWFTVLLNLKHLYVVLAPAYFVYLLRNYCFQDKGAGVSWRNFSVKNFFKLSAVVLGVTALSFGPFLYYGQLSQVVSRLFPFKRGLTHAYWAPNVWAVYNTVDKIASIIGQHYGWYNGVGGSAVMTGGLVQEFQHSVLPSVSPIVTLILTLLSVLPAMYTLWKRPGNTVEFVRSLILCAFGAFIFGWHVHEKAILNIIIPLSLLSLVNGAHARSFLFLSIVANASLFPLLHEDAESLTKVLLFLLSAFYTAFSISLKYRTEWLTLRNPLPFLCIPETVYLLGLLSVLLYSGIVHQLLGLGQRLPFLPLMLLSFYCALGVLYGFWRLYFLSFMKPLDAPHEKTH